VTVTPHFALPFRLGANGAVVNEQDGIDDIATCVVAIMSTHVGWRDEEPEFGIPDLTFHRQPIGASDILEMISGQEPRALMLVEEHPDRTDRLMDTITVGVSLYAKGNR
jgi:hypothetical protein